MHAPHCPFTLELENLRDFGMGGGSIRGRLEGMLVAALAQLPSCPFFLLDDQMILWRCHESGGDAGGRPLVGLKLSVAVHSIQSDLDKPGKQIATLEISASPSLRVLLPFSLTVHRAAWERMGLGEIQGINSDEFCPAGGVYVPLVEQDSRCVVLPSMRPAIVQAISRNYPLVDAEQQRLLPQRDVLAASLAAATVVSALAPMLQGLKGTASTPAAGETVWCVLSYPLLDSDDGVEDNDLAREPYIVPSELLVRVGAEYTTNPPPTYLSLVDRTFQELMSFLDNFTLPMPNAPSAVLRRSGGGNPVPIGIVAALCVPCGVVREQSSETHNGSATNVDVDVELQRQSTASLKILPSKRPTKRTRGM